MVREVGLEPTGSLQPRLPKPERYQLRDYTLNMEQVIGFEPMTLTWKESVLPTKLNLQQNKYVRQKHELPYDNYYKAKRTFLTLIQYDPKTFSLTIQNLFL